MKIISDININRSSFQLGAPLLFNSCYFCTCHLGIRSRSNHNIMYSVFKTYNPYGANLMGCVKLDIQQLKHRGN
jgi:hypothetical protein